MLQLIFIITVTLVLLTHLKNWVSNSNEYCAKTVIIRWWSVFGTFNKNSDKKFLRCLTGTLSR